MLELKVKVLRSFRICRPFSVQFAVPTRGCCCWFGMGLPDPSSSSSRRGPHFEVDRPTGGGRAPGCRVAAVVGAGRSELRRL